MSNTDATLAQIEEYVALAASRRRHAVSAEDKARMAALEERLRDEIAGARPGPKHIESPEAAEAKPTTAVAPARIDLFPSKGASAPGPLDLDGFAEQVPLSANDEAKTSGVSIEKISSQYTPSRAPAYLEDYYDASVVPEVVDTEIQPHKAVTPDGAPADLSAEARILFGIGVRPLTARSERRPHIDPGPTTEPANPPLNAAPAAEAAAPSASEPSGPQAILYTVDGSSSRGTLPSFDPDATTVELVTEDGPRRYPLRQVLALFVRMQSGKPPTPTVGDRVLVRLVNDREVLGVTPDYRPGGMSLTVVPEPRHGNVDRVWIPAWAVKAIEMDDIAE